MNQALVDNIIRKMEADEAMQFLPTKEQVETCKHFIFHGCCLGCEFQRSLGVSFCENCEFGMNDLTLPNLSLYDFNSIVKKMFLDADLKLMLKKNVKYICDSVKIDIGQGNTFQFSI